MKVVILAGGLGTRLAEETEARPKPMVEIGGQPILWHILKHYAHHGHREAYIALGYMGTTIKRYFLDYLQFNGDLTISLGSRKVERQPPLEDDWTLHLVDTGYHTITGGRLKRLEKHLDDGTFLMTYGDGVSNVDLDRLVAFHKAHGKLATVTAVRPPARFGGLEFSGDRVVRFTEKPQLGDGWINGGYFVLEPGVFDYVEGDLTHWEREPLERLASDGQLMAYRHEAFWQCMDTIRDKRLLESLWAGGSPPWKVWP
ncbi:MAG: glucose-1-phosphate cytidylyltransferase [Isosphaeraceae bacterium]